MLKHKKISHTRNQDGFTLVEVVIASAIMMMVFVALLGVISFARRIQSQTENRLAHLHIARQVLESYSNLGYDSAEFAVGTRQLPNNIGTCVITQVSGQSTKDVTVTINWVEPLGMAQSITLRSSFSRSLHR